MPSWWLCPSVSYFEQLLSLSNYLVLQLNPWYVFVSLPQYSPGLQEALHKPNPPCSTLPPCPWKEGPRIAVNSVQRGGPSLARLMPAFTMAKQSQGTMNNSGPLTDTRAVAHLCHLARRGGADGWAEGRGRGEEMPPTASKR